MTTEKPKKMTRLFPMHDNIFVEKDLPEEKTSPAGIILTQDAQQAPDTAVVIAVGPGRIMGDGTKVTPQVKVGDKILMGSFSGVQVNWGMEKRMIVPWSEVLGIVVED